MNFSEEEGEILGNEMKWNMFFLLVWIFNVRKVSHPEIIVTFSDDIGIWDHMSEMAAWYVYCEFSNFVFATSWFFLWNLSILGCVKMRSPQIHRVSYSNVSFPVDFGVVLNFDTHTHTFTKLCPIIIISSNCLSQINMFVDSKNWNSPCKQENRGPLQPTNITLRSSFRGETNHCERRICWTFWTGNPWLSRKMS